MNRKSALLLVSSLLLAFAAGAQDTFQQTLSRFRLDEPVSATQTPPLVDFLGTGEVLPGDHVRCAVFLPAADGNRRSRVRLEAQYQELTAGAPPLPPVTLPAHKTKANGWTAPWHVPPPPETAGEVALAVSAEVLGGPPAQDGVLNCTHGPARTCTDSATTGCLYGGDRFKVSVDWADPFNGQSRQAEVASRSNDELEFFFPPTNLDLLVRVLDACEDPLFNHFWVFYGGTANVEYTLTVEDTDSGAVRRYFNPAGTASPPIQDTEAFATCP